MLHELIITEVMCGGSHVPVCVTLIETVPLTAFGSLEVICTSYVPVARSEGMSSVISAKGPDPLAVNVPNTVPFVNSAVNSFPALNVPVVVKLKVPLSVVGPLQSTVKGPPVIVPSLIVFELPQHEDV